MIANLFNTIEDAFINSAYLSELWAVKDLLRIKSEFPAAWNSFREEQLQDEIRHANLLLKVLKKNNGIHIDSLSYSMQERLYKKYINLTLSDSPGASAAVHNMTESRALWIYKTYKKFGKNPDYLSCVDEIVEDEKSHFQCNASLLTKEDFFLEKCIKGIDKSLFRSLLPERYGKFLFLSEKFWSDYYKGALFTSSTSSISLF